jgi:signal transduction histidine kinase
MELGAKYEPNSYRKLLQALEDVLTKDMYMLIKDPPYFIKEGNHKVFINKQFDYEDGQYVPYVYDVNTFFLKDPNGQVSVVVCYEDLNSSLQVKETPSSDISSALDELAAAAVHEIRNPLFSIKGFAQLLESSFESNDKRREYTHLMVSELDRLHKLLDEFLVFMQENKSKFTTVDIKQIIQETTSLLGPQFESKKLSVHVDIEDNMPAAKGSNEQLKQALLNLLLNSIDATEPEESIEIKAFAQSGKIHISIKDEGTGIGDEIASDVFKPFCTTKKKGTGLGLYITKKIVENHDGNIFFKSESGKGTTFFLELPAVK